MNRQRIRKSATSSALGLSARLPSAFETLARRAAISRVTFADWRAGSSVGGVVPDRAQALADVLVAQIVEIDAEAVAVRELRVVLALAGEVGIDLDAVADVADEHERRPAVDAGSALGVVLRLLPGVHHQLVPDAVGAALAARVGVRHEQVGLAGELQLLLAVLLAALLGFDDEGAALVEVDAAGAGRAVRILELDAALEGVDVLVRGFDRACRFFNAEDFAQVFGERLKIRAFLAAGCAPADDEVFDGISLPQSRSSYPIIRRRTGRQILDGQSKSLTFCIPWDTFRHMIEIRELPEFSDWMQALRDSMARARIAARIRRLQLGNPGDVQAVGEGVSELRIHHGPGFRVYFVWHGDEIVILLCGGDKKSQDKDIARAKALAKELKE